MKKVLIISYYWPPCGGIGVLRCLKLAKYLRNFGWEPIVYTAENPHYPTYDNTNFKDIPVGMTILKQRIWEPYRLYKLFTGKAKDENVNNVFYANSDKAGVIHDLSVRIRSNFFIPDARSMWIKPSVKFLLKYLRDHKVDAIFSDGPPHTNTRIANLLKKETGIPWLADFQDPWTQVDYYSLLKLTARSDAKHKRLEQEVFSYADKITIASPTWASELEDIGAQSVSWYPYGYDPDDFLSLKDNVANKFIISHLGIIGFDRNPHIFLEAISELLESDNQFRKDLCINLPGQIDISVKESIEKNKLNEYVVLPGNLDREIALQSMKDSSVLLLLLNKQPNAKGRIPGKIYEYLAVKRSILCLGPDDSDCAQILEDTESGVSVKYDEKQKIKSYISNQYASFKKGTIISNLDTDIEAFSHQNIIEDVATILNKITN